MNDQHVFQKVDDGNVKLIFEGRKWVVVNTATINAWDGRAGKVQLKKKMQVISRNKSHQK